MRCLLPVFLSFYLGSAEQCSAHNCDANTVQKAGVTEYTADAQATCCEASCSGYTCTTADHTLKADAASTAKGDDATAEATCCEQSCTGYSCTTADHSLKTDAATTPRGADAEAACCAATATPQKCTGYECTGNTKLGENADTTDRTDNPQTACCVAKKCDEHTCATADHTLIAAAATTDQGADAETTCCTPSCTGYSCTTADHSLKTDAATTPRGADAEAACCAATTTEEKCTGYECTGNTKLGENPDTIDRTDNPQTACCVAKKCDEHTCATADHTLIAAAATTDQGADAETACCTASCSGYSCTTADHTLKADAASTPKGDDATAEATCCEQSCTGYACTTSGHSLTAEAATTPRGTDAEAACCAAAAAAKCDSYTCAAGHKLKTDAATTDMGATPEATCCEDDAANPAVPVSGVITFVAEAEMAEAKTAVEKMLMATLDVTNAADVMVTVASEMKMASGTRRLDGHAGVYTHTANFTVNFADFAKATTAHTALEGLTTEAAETALKEQLLAASAHETADPEWSLTLAAVVDPASCQAFKCPVGQKMKAGTEATAASAAACCEVDPAITVQKVNGTMVFDVDGTDEQVINAVKDMLHETLGVDMQDVIVTVTSAAVASGTTRRLEVKTFTAEYTVNFADLAAATTAHTSLTALSAEDAALALSHALEEFGVTVASGFSVTNTPGEAPTATTTTTAAAEASGSREMSLAFVAVAAFVASVC